jgi:hypothetical protein
LDSRRIPLYRRGANAGFCERSEEHLTRRKLFQWFTVLLLLVSLWTVYANVLSDDTDVRAKAKATVNHAAGCGDDCKHESLRGERGMIEERIEYDLLRHGHWVVVCRRAMIVAGDYACVVTEGAAPSPPPSASAKR